MGPTEMGGTSSKPTTSATNAVLAPVTMQEVAPQAAPTLLSPSHDGIKKVSEASVASAATAVAEPDVEEGPDVEKLQEAPALEGLQVATSQESRNLPPQAPGATTSRVLPHPEGWQEEGILFPHEGIRFLMEEL